MMVPALTLNTGAEIPQLGLGTWPLDNAAVVDAIVEAVGIGYRHFDTATQYGNEAGVGEGIRRSGLDRSEIFVTTKLSGDFQGNDRAIGGLDAALKRMGLKYVDLLLIHWPLPWRDQFVSTWHTFEQLLGQGRARAIGVSNFTVAHLEQLATDSTVVPAVNQIQLSPYITRDAQRAYAEAHGIATVAWGPLGGEGGRLLDDPTISEIANRIGRSAAPVVLRWHVQRGGGAVPKSASPARMAENLAAFDFELADHDMATIDALSRGPTAGIDADTAGH